MGDDISELISLFFVGTIIVLIVTHAKGFATSAGSLFTITNGLVGSLSGTSTVTPATTTALPSTTAPASKSGGLLSNAPGGISGVEQYLKSNPVSGAAKTAIKQILGII